VSGLVAFTSPKTGCGTYTKTQSPIVLAHRAAGFDSLFGILDYWFGIPEDLAAGGAKVFVIEVSQFNTPEVRGEQLIAQLEQIRAITGKPKVNLIGHSQGGLDVRYAAAVRPDLVASVTTIGAPHQGAQIADYLDANFLNGGFTQDVIANFANELGTIIGLLSGSSNPQDAIAGMPARRPTSVTTAPWKVSRRAAEGSIAAAPTSHLRVRSTRRAAWLAAARRRQYALSREGNSMSSLSMSRSEREAFLAGTHVAILTVADGTRGPLALPVWYRYEPGGEVRIVTGRTSRKLGLIKKAGRVSLCVQTETAPYEYVTVEGPATIGEPDHERDIRGVAIRYLGERVGEMYLAMTAEQRAAEGEVLVSVRPERWLTADFHKMTG